MSSRPIWLFKELCYGEYSHQSFTGSRRTCGGLRAIPVSRSGRATSYQSPLRFGVWKSGQPGGNFSVQNLVGTDDVPEKPHPPATLPGKTYPYMRRVFLSRAALPSEPGTYLGRIRGSLISIAMA
jgi:hypothetical protein